MKDINFLPASFLGRQRRRRDWVFCGGAAIATCCVLVAIFILMCMLRRSVVHSSDALDSRIASSRDRQRDFANLNLQLASQNEKALLLAYIDQEWPVSRLLAEITEPLPSRIALLEMSYNRDDGEKSTTGNPFDQSTKETESSSESPFAADLKTIRGIVEESPWVITIKGETSDAAVLHLFVDKLNSSAMFDDVALEGFHASGNTNERTRQFTLRLTVASGHAQTNGGRFQPDNAKEKASVAEILHET